jgi:hypothetical protein
MRGEKLEEKLEASAELKLISISGAFKARIFFFRVKVALANAN